MRTIWEVFRFDEEGTVAAVVLTCDPSAFGVGSTEPPRPSSPARSCSVRGLDDGSGGGGVGAAAGAGGGGGVGGAEAPEADVSAPFSLAASFAGPAFSFSFCNARMMATSFSFSPVSAANIASAASAGEWSALAALRTAASRRRALITSACSGSI